MPTIVKIASLDDYADRIKRLRPDDASRTDGTIYFALDASQPDVKLPQKEGEPLPGKLLRAVMVISAVHGTTVFENTRTVGEAIATNADEMTKFGQEIIAEKNKATDTLTKICTGWKIVEGATGFV